MCHWGQPITYNLGLTIIISAKFLHCKANGFRVCGCKNSGSVKVTFFRDGPHNLIFLHCITKSMFRQFKSADNSRPLIDIIAKYIFYLKLTRIFPCAGFRSKLPFQPVSKETVVINFGFKEPNWLIWKLFM